MNRTLTGLRAIIQKKIDDLDTEIRLLAQTSIDCNCLVERRQKLRSELDTELMTKRVIVFGTFHKAQKAGHPSNDDLVSRLSFLIKKFAVTVLMEEWASCHGTSAAAGLQSGDLSYKVIEAPNEEPFRTLRFAVTNHPRHDGTLPSCESMPAIMEYGGLAEQENREKFMAQEIGDEMQNHRVGMFIVGLAHLHSISVKLQAAGFKVTTYYWMGEGQQPLASFSGPRAPEI